LGYRCFDKNLMLGLAAATGLAPRQSLTCRMRSLRGSLVERLFRNIHASMADPSAWAAG
jgi:hypothetical protein